MILPIITKAEQEVPEKYSDNHQPAVFLFSWHADNVSAPCYMNRKWSPKTCMQFAYPLLYILQNTRVTQWQMKTVLWSEKRDDTLNHPTLIQKHHNIRAHSNTCYRWVFSHSKHNSSRNNGPWYSERESLRGKDLFVKVCSASPSLKCSVHSHTGAG